MTKVTKNPLCPDQIPLDLIDEVRKQNPLIHNITNLVSANFTANGLLAIGASPMMAESPLEMAELAKISSAVVLNIGTPSDPKTSAMMIAGQTANAHGIPVVLDPVAVSASALRQSTIYQISQVVQFDAIRGNAGELAFLAGANWQAKGVDAGRGDADLASICQAVASKYRTIAILTGEIDYISDGTQVVALANGTPLLPKVTATGCLLSAVAGAFLAVAGRERYLVGAVNACATFAIAGELACEGLLSSQSGTFMYQFLDKLGGISPNEIANRIKFVGEKA